MSKEKKFRDPCNIKEIRDLLDIIDRPIAFRRVLVTLTGSVQSALMLSQAIFWQERANQLDGWWYKTMEAWQEETGLNRTAFRTARRRNKKYLQSRLRGVPARLYWKVDREVLIADLLWLNPNSTEAGRSETVSQEVASVGDGTDMPIRKEPAPVISDKPFVRTEPPGVQNLQGCQNCGGVKTAPFDMPVAHVDISGSVESVPLEGRNSPITLRGMTPIAGQNDPTTPLKPPGQESPVDANINKNTETTTENMSGNKLKTLSPRAEENSLVIIQEETGKNEPSDLPLLVKDYSRVLPEEDPAGVEQFVRNAAQAYSAGWLREAVIEAVMRNKRSLQGVGEVLEMWKSFGRDRNTMHTGCCFDGVE